MNREQGKTLLGILVIILLLGSILGVNYLKTRQIEIDTAVTSVPVISGSLQAAADLSPTRTHIDDKLSRQILQDLIEEGIACNSGDADANLSGSCRVEKVAGNYAKGLMLQAYWLAVKVDEKWTIAITGNGIPLCSEIDKFSIPQDIYGNCIDVNGELRN